MPAPASLSIAAVVDQVGGLEAVDAYLTTIREAVELPGELRKAADEHVTKINERLDGINEQFGRWVFLDSLRAYVVAVQEGRNPSAVLLHGNEQRLMVAVDNARTAVRMRTRGATVDDMIAAGRALHRAGHVLLPTGHSGHLRARRGDPNVIDGRTVYLTR